VSNGATASPLVHSVKDTAVLVDHEIRQAIAGGELAVADYEPEMVRPASLRLRLGSTAYVLASDGPVDTADEATYPRLVARSLDRGRIVVRPGEVVLAPTHERLRLPETMVGLVDGTSDVARLGLTMVLAHQVSPGFGAPDGAVLTLEIVSHVRHPVYLWPCSPLCNLMLLRCGPVERPYSAMPFHHSAERDATRSYLASSAPVHRGR
jgi:dCTP deaminase